MPIVVQVVEQDQYAAWVAEQKKKSAAVQPDPNKQWTLDELRAQGEKVYAQNCVACHQANGMGVPNTFPALSGSKIATGDKAAHIHIVMDGKPGTAMAPFKHLSDVEIAAVVTYERNAWNNKTGEMISPADIKAARK
jgi:cytochrome c oxidase subunit 2